MSLEGTLLNEKRTALIEPKPSGPEERIPTKHETLVQNLGETSIQNSQISESSFLYVISSRWLQEWKKYTAQSNTTSESLSNEDFLRKFDMGKINQDIVKKEPKFLTYPDEDDYRNVILKEGLEENIDYKLMTESEWKYFAGMSDHITIKRPVHTLPNGEKKPEIALKKVRIILLNNRSYREIDHRRISEFRVYCLQVSKYSSIKEFKSDLFRILNSEKNGNIMNTSANCDFCNPEVSENFSHLWLLDPALDLTNFFRNVRTICSETPSYDYRIEFQGQYLEKNSKLSFNEVDIADEDVIFLDFESSDKGCTFFGDGARVLQKCEFCSQWRHLKFLCECKKVMYCSKDCKMKDKRFHVRRCPFGQAVNN